MYYCGDDHHDDGDDDDDGANGFECHWLDDAVDFVDLTMIAMDHNVAFRYLDHF